MYRKVRACLSRNSLSECFLLGVFLTLTVLMLLEGYFKDPEISRDIINDLEKPGIPISRNPQNRIPTSENPRTADDSLKHPPSGAKDTAPEDPASIAFREAVLKHMDPETRIIVLSYGKLGNRNFAINLYRSSYKNLKIENHLFVGTDEEFCGVMRSHGANCVKLIGSKTCPKTKMVMDALNIGAVVLFVNLDVVFMKNPLPDMKCKDCDLIIQSDGVSNNFSTGFYLMKPTNASHRLLQRVCEKMDLARADDENDQQIINPILIEMWKKKEIKKVILDPKKYANGMSFFRDGKRVFKGDHPCAECVMVHNNDVFSKAAKAYRFKEYGLWDVDENHYYSDPHRKYLTYDNPHTFSSAEETKTNEYWALRAALMIGHALNRTVILPAFHVKGEAANLLGLVNLPTMNEYLSDKYREHVFLQHALVPAVTKYNRTSPFLLRSALGNVKYTFDPKQVTVKTFQSKTLEPELIKMWFTKTSAKVLHFHSLYIYVSAATPEMKQVVALLDSGMKRV